MDHVDVDYEIEALWLDPSPVLIGQRNVQVDDGHHIAQLVPSSVRFYTENGNKRHCCWCKHFQWQTQVKHYGASVPLYDSSDDTETNTSEFLLTLSDGIRLFTWPLTVGRILTAARLYSARPERSVWHVVRYRRKSPEPAGLSPSLRWPGAPPRWAPCSSPQQGRSASSS